MKDPMQHVSKNYRQDDTNTPIDPALAAYLDEHFLRPLPYIHETNPKVLVVFSGGNAVGKTTISRKLGSEFKGLIIENDAVKRCMLEFDPTINNNQDTFNRLTWQYTINLYKHLSSKTKNGLVIRDGVIDWYFDRILPIFEKAGYRLFIIGFDISEQKARELINKRGDTATADEETFYKLLDEHNIHQARFRKIYTPNIILSDDTIFNHDLVVDKLKRFLKITK